MTAPASWRVELARLVAGQVLLHAVIAGGRMSSSLTALQDGHSKTAVGVLIALFATAQIFFVLPAGRLTDRRGLKFVLAGAAVAACSGMVLTALWPVYPVMCLGAVAGGGAVGAATVAFQRHAGRVAQGGHELRRAFAWITIAPAGASILGPLAAGPMLDHAGPRAAFALLSVFPVAAWLSARCARDLPPVPDTERATGSAWGLWRDANFRQLVAANWFVSAAWDLHGFMVPVLGHDLGFSASGIGSILSAFALAAAAVRLSTAAITRVVPEWPLLRGAVFATAAMLAVYPLFTTVPALMACAVVLGIVLGSVQPTVLALLHSTMPPHRQSQALGMRLITINASNVISPMLMGAAGGALGVASVFWGLASVIGVASAWVLRRRHAPAAPAERAGP